jgi:hypothetical protein
MPNQFDTTKAVIKKLCIPGRPVTFHDLHTAGARCIMTCSKLIEKEGHQFYIHVDKSFWWGSTITKLDREEII